MRQKAPKKSVFNRYSNNDAISPVVGVMLMIVVTVIIAAVLSGFAGGMIGPGTKKAPTLSMTVKIVNTGDWHGSGFFATVTAVSDPIPTKDLKIVTSWKGRQQYVPNIPEGTNQQLWRDSGAPTSQTVIADGSMVIANGSSNINVLNNPNLSVKLKGLYVAPFGNGPGVNGTEAIGSTDRSYSLPDQQFGNYTLVQGSTMTATPCGAIDTDSIGSTGQSNSYGGYGMLYPYGGGTRYPYLYKNCPDSGSNTCIDPTKAVLGINWYNLVWGDTVNVKVIYVPTGEVIFNQDVPVTES